MGKFNQLYASFMSQLHENIDRTVGLGYLQSVQSDDPFDTNIKLYHVTHVSQLHDVFTRGLLPKKPKSSIHGGQIKGENFKGIWLTNLDDLDWIVDNHMLPKTFYSQGRLLEIDCSRLNESLFSIGIEIPPSLQISIDNGEKISRNDYLRMSNEIVYLGSIPPQYITET